MVLHRFQIFKPWATQPLPLPTESLLLEGLPAGVGLAIDPDPLSL